MDIPIRFLENQRVAPDTYVIRQLAGEGAQPALLFVNSMVITGAEPVIVDTGPALTRDGWLEKAFEVVDPADVRWIYLSHDDVDHTGNLQEVIERCPQADIVTTWFMVERMMGSVEIPMDRMRWINDGESFHAGDRELLAVTPPTFDSPTTRGLFDTKSGVYWAADSFATLVTHEVETFGELDADFVREAFLAVNAMVSPWHQWLDVAKYRAHLDRVHALDPKVVTGGHGPAVVGGQINAAFELLAQLPSAPAAPLPGQPDLDAMIAALAA